MAAAANTGESREPVILYNKPAARGIPAMLYAKAKNKFCLMFLITTFERFKDFTIPLKSPLIRVISELSMATSVPVPMAMPTSAKVKAGASFTPSPAIPIISPFAFSFSMTPLFSAGRTSAYTSYIPSLSATDLAVKRLSPVNMTILTPNDLRSCRAS